MRHWLDRQFPGSWICRHGLVEWPPTSPDLTSLDVYLRGHLKFTVYRVKVQNMGHLKKSIRDTNTRVTPDELKRVSHEWERRISTCCHCNGARIEQVLWKNKLFSRCLETFHSPCTLTTGTATRQ